MSDAEGRALFSGGSELPFDAAAALAHLQRADRRLSALIERVGPFRLRLETMHTPFASLAEAILHQQLNGRAAATIVGRFKDRIGGGAFPAPAAVLAAAEEDLRGCGLSRSKLLAVRDLAEKTLDGTVPGAAALHAMGEEELVERLTAVRGIGRWTVEMLLIFRLGRPDVLPVGDFGVRKGYALAFRKRELPTPAQLLRHGERWRPFRTVASWYLWRATELPGEAPRKDA